MYYIIQCDVVRETAARYKNKRKEALNTANSRSRITLRKNLSSSFEFSKRNKFSEKKKKKEKPISFGR